MVKIQDHYISTVIFAQMMPCSSTCGIIVARGFVTDHSEESKIFFILGYNTEGTEFKVLDELILPDTNDSIPEGKTIRLSSGGITADFIMGCNSMMSINIQDENVYVGSEEMKVCFMIPPAWKISKPVIPNPDFI